VIKKICPRWKDKASLRAFPSGMSNAKYLAFDTPNTKKPLSSGVLNAKI